jgi:hypothetical protein
VEPKLDALAKTDADLEARVKTDFTQYGESKENEVATELMSVHDVISKLRARAESESRESEDFVADLSRALETASEDKVARVETRHKKKHDDGAPAASPKPAAQASDQTAATPKAQPAIPKPADTGEVFTP